MKMKLIFVLGIFIALTGISRAETVTPPPGKIVSRPLYRDPVFDHPTDPVLTYNAESHRWLMYYTQRRGDGIPLIHGTKIGIAASEDGGATW
jgi:hypothetical protein